MKKKYLAVAALSMALAAGSAMTSFAAGFVHTSQGTKYQWGSGDYCTNNWVNYKNHWFFFGEDQIMRTGWIQRDGTWYYAADTGELQGGIMKINGNVYYFDNNSCKLKTGERTGSVVSYKPKRPSGGFPPKGPVYVLPGHTGMNRMPAPKINVWRTVEHDGLPLSRTSFSLSFLGLLLRNQLSSVLVCNQRLPEGELWRCRDGLHRPVLLCRRRER